jgi:cell division septal protein FtsQ
MATEKRQSPRQNRERRQAQPQPKRSEPAVVRTQPKPFDRRHLMLKIWTIVAVVLAASIGLSIFFRVDEITVTGCDKYSAWSVSEAAGIQMGDSILFFGKATASSRIMDALPFIKSVRFRIKLPGSVDIIIEEAPVGYAVEAADGSWWLLTADGKVAQQTDAVNAQNNTIIKGVNLADPKLGETAKAYQSQEDGAVTGADRLSAALHLAQLLEKNEIMGTMRYIDVSNLQQIQLWYKNQYSIALGDQQEMETKIATVAAAIPKIGSFQTGVMKLVKDGTVWKVVFSNQENT